MTTTTILRGTYGPKRRLVCAIDGLEELIWQDDGTGVAPQREPRMAAATYGYHRTTDPYCLALWRFNEAGATDDAVDATGNGHTGTQTGSPTVETGRYSNARGFSNGSYFTVAESALLKPSRWTWAGWVYYDGTLSGSGNWQRAVFYDSTLASSSDAAIQISVKNDATKAVWAWILTAGGYVSAAASSELSTGWHHIGVTWDNTTLSLYVDGSLAGTGTGSGNVVFGDGYLRFGNDPNWVDLGEHWRGHLDDFAFYSECKSATWVYKAYRGDWTTDIVALEPPNGELSFGVDIGEMSISPPAMTIAFRNVDDPSAPTTKFFAKMFAPGRHASSSQQSCHLQRTDDQDPYVLSTATTIKLKGDNTSWTTPGFAYTARETFYYTGATGSTFTGCIRGKFSCTDLSGVAAWAPTYKVPDYSSTTVDALGIEISTVPYSWIGRRIALHVVAYDEDLDVWRSDISAAIDGDLLWVGRIKSIRYNGERGTWELGCDHIIADLEEKIFNGMPSNAQLYGINLSGGLGRTFKIYVVDPDGALQASANCVVTQGVYSSPLTLAANINNQIASSAITYAFQAWIAFGTDGSCYFKAVNQRATEDLGLIVSLRDDNGFPCHAWWALGWDQPNDDMPNIETGILAAGAYSSELGAYNPPCLSYHPLGQSVNGGYLCKTVAAAGDKAELWDPIVGDYGALRDTVAMDCAHFDGAQERQTHYCRYSSIVNTATFVGEPTSTVGQLVLNWSEFDQVQPYQPRFSYAAQRLNDEPAVLRNVWSPHRATSSGRIRGPFELLLYPLLSTGTAAANDATYDQLHFECSAAMSSDLVDTTSFIDADLDIMGSPLSQRIAYVIPEAISWMDLLKRESKLFGYVLAWDASQGKLSLRSAYAHSIDTYTETLSDSNGIDPYEFPDVDISDATVINRWETSVVYNRRTRKYDKPIIVEDEDSIQQLRTAKTVKVEHPGVFLKDGTLGAADEAVRLLFVQNRYCWRYPWMVITKTLAPYLLNRISIGDIVLFTSARIPDPYGSGTMDVSCIAFVTNLTWNLTDWTGKATLLLYSGYDAALMTPWAWSAVTSSWNAGTYQLTVVEKTWGESGDSDDAAEVEAGDYLDIVERAPADPTSEQKWTALLVAQDYETDGAGIITFDATVSLGGWDATKQYIVMPSLYANVVTEQKAENAFIAAASVGLLGSDPAHRYG